MAYAPEGVSMNTFPIIRSHHQTADSRTSCCSHCTSNFTATLDPGGGFQAGVILASGLILYGLVFGLQAAKQLRHRS